MKKLHARVKEYRELLGITQRSLAIFLGISRKSIQYYESGRMIPSIINLIKMINHARDMKVDLTLDWFFE